MGPLLIGTIALLKAIADKLIPGIRDDQRIAILQQTEALDGVKPTGEAAKQTTLEHVIDRATAKDVIEQEIRSKIHLECDSILKLHLTTLSSVLSEGVDASDPHTSIRALRGLKHERMQRRLFRLDKDARLRSGARGFDARKLLKAYEKEVAESDE
jgi:hypothetical protein